MFTRAFENSVFGDGELKESKLQYKSQMSNEEASVPSKNNGKDFKALNKKSLSTVVNR